MSIVDFLIQNQYGCVKFDSNKDKLTKIIPSVAGETGVCILRNTLSDLELTKKYISVAGGKDKSKVSLMTAYEFVENLDKNLNKYSLLFIDDFQKSDFYMLAIMNEWYKRYHKESERLPYLLMGSIAVSYQKIPLPLNIEKVLDLSYTSFKIVTGNDTIVDENTIIVEHSKKNYALGSDELYENLMDIIQEEVKHYESGNRAIVYLPNEEKMKLVGDGLEKRLSKKIIIIQLLPDSKVSSPYREGDESIIIILTLDYTRLGIYFPQIKTVFDSGEATRIYNTRTGGQGQFLKKIDREELELRRESYMPKKYIIMIPVESIKNLRKNTIPISYRINLAPHILHLIRHNITDLSWFNQKHAILDLEKTGAIDVDMGITEFGLYASGLFEEGFDLNIYHTHLLYMSEKEYMFPVIVLVSLFQNKTGKYFHSGMEETFQNIYYSLSKESSPFADNINNEMLENMLEMIDRLCDVLDVEKRIYNPKLAWNKIRKYIDKVYNSKLCRYEGGEYKNGSGERMRIYGKRIEGNISKIILPISTFKNEKGECFTDFYVCMKPFS